MGGHFMSERSYSHKSDGRQSSAGHSVHSVASGRANSLTSYGAMTPLETPGLAPGLLILGSVPAIIRCWLTTNFKHDTLLYAAICSGSYASYVDVRLINQLGFQDQMRCSDDGLLKIKLTFFLPEAIPLTNSSRSNSPTPQVPSLDIDFTVVEARAGQVNDKTIQIFLGSDTLRTHNADILFSSNQLTLYDEHGKLQVPLVRPEDERSFKSLCITSGSPNLFKQGGSPTQPTPAPSKIVTFATTDQPEMTRNGERSTSFTDDASSMGRRSLEQHISPGSGASGLDANGSAKEGGPGVRSTSTGGSWPAWRRDMGSPSAAELVKSATTPPTQRSGMKVLKKPRSSSSAGSASVPQLDKGQSRFFDSGRGRTATSMGSEPGEPSQKAAVRLSSRSGREEPSKDSTVAQAKARVENPIGGATAFGWLNPNAGKPK
jgi:ubiquitin carboxyl-terminal hydrolase 4/11